jgi:hypothetical protein
MIESDSSSVLIHRRMGDTMSRTEFRRTAITVVLLLVGVAAVAALMSYYLVH